MRRKNVFLCMVLVMVSTNNLVFPVTSTTTTNFGDEKNYYSPDPHVTTPSSGVPSNPSKSSTHHGSTHKHNSHGSPSSGQSNCGTPPSSGGSGGYYPSPTPTPPSPSHGGGGGGSIHPPKHTPSNPPSGGGCVCRPPPSLSPPSQSPPSSGGSGGYYPPTPSTPTPTPVIVTPPSSPLVPSPLTPLVPSPLIPRTPISPYDPNVPPFPCTYWGSHPSLIFGVLGWWATAGGVFGVAALPGLNSATSLQQLLTNPRNDGYGALYREGTASLLNSMAAKQFTFSPKQVKDAFLASLNSEKAAAIQARLFKLANERKYKPYTTNP